MQKSNNDMSEVTDLSFVSNPDRTKQWQKRLRQVAELTRIHLVL